jgi:hypothetical protein
MIHKAACCDAHMNDLMQEAQLHYNLASFDVIRPGTYVTCSVTGLRILLRDLKYWNAERQEPYANPKVMLQRHRELHE